MCVIASIDKGCKIEKENFDACFDSNPDGFGMMYVKDSVVVIQKTLIKKVAWNLYDYAISNGLHNDSPFILHFRIGTSGGKNMNNCHPFFVNKNSNTQRRLAFCHNGILHKGSATKSDTVMFNEEILSKIEPDLYSGNSGAFKLVEKYIGANNKLAFMNDNGEVTIVNKTPWIKEGGILYSNSSYKPYTPHKGVGWSWDNKNGFVHDKKITDKTPLVKSEKEVYTKKCVVCTRSSTELDVDNKFFPTVVYNGNAYHVCPDCAEFMTVNEALKWAGALKEAEAEVDAYKTKNQTKWKECLS